MNLRFASLLLLYSFVVGAQQKIVKTLKCDAPYVEVKADGIDNLVIEESDTNEFVMAIIDHDGLGFVENFSSNDFNCVLNIKTELKVKNPLTNKINQFPIKPPTNVSAVIKIPRHKKVTVFGETIDIQARGYEGTLRILIDKGNVRLKSIKGITEVRLFTGNVFASIKSNALDIRTRKGTITLDNIVQKSPLKEKGKKSALLLVKTVNANVVLTQL